MAQYLELPNGAYFELKEGQTAQEGMSVAQKLYPDAFGIKPKEAAPKKTGLMADVGSSVENLANITRTGIGSLFGDATEAAQAGAKREQAIGDKYAPTFQTEKITKPFEEGEYGTAAMEAVKGVPGAAAQLAPSIGQEMGLALAGRIGGGAVGTLFGPAGTAIGSQIGQYAVPLLVNTIQALGSQAQSKVQDQLQKGEKPDVSAMELAPYAAGNAALNLVGTRIAMPSVFKKAIGQKVEQEAESAVRAKLLKEAEEVAGRGTAKAIGMGVGKFAFGELPTEVLQDVIDRAAIGKPLADDDAITQYRSTALSMVLASPLGGGFGLHERASARGQIAQQKEADRLAGLQNVPPPPPETTTTLTEGMVAETKAAIDKLSTELKDLHASLESTVRKGDMTTAATLQEEIAKRQASIATLSESLPPEAVAPAEQSWSDARLQADYSRLAGGTDKNGNPKQGLYVSAVMSGDMETAQQHLEQLQKLQAEIQRRAEKNRPNIAAQQQLSLLGDEENQVAPDIETLYPQGGMQTMPPAPTISQALGAVKAATPENYQYGRAPIATQLNVAPAEPQPRTTLDFKQQDLRFANPLSRDFLTHGLQPGGSAATPIEAVQAKIETLRMRPNMPATTLQQLDNYAKVLENPALADTENQAAQNAFEIIAENVDRIAYAGFGQGAVRNMSSGEVQGQLKGLYDRATALNTRMAQVQQEMATATDPDQRFALSQEYANGRRSMGAIEQQISGLRNQGRTTETTAYNQRTTQLVPLPEGPTSPFKDEASEAQIARTQAGDKRGREAAPVNPYPTTQIADETTFRLEPGEDGEMVSVAETAPVERPVPAQEVAGPPANRATIERGGMQTIGITRQGPSDAELQQELAALTPQDRATLDLWDPVFGEGSPTRQLVLKAETGLQETQRIVGDTENALLLAQKDLEAKEAALQAVMAANPLRHQAKFLEGEIAQKERDYTRTRAGVENAVEVNKMADATVKAKVAETEAALAKARGAYDAAKAKAEEALAKFNQEWDRLRESGLVSDELLAFITDVRTASATISMATRGAEKADTSLRTALQDAGTALNEVLSRSEAKDKVAQINELLAATEKRLPAAYNTTRAYNLLQDVIPQIRSLMGPRVASLADTLLRIKLAERIIGKAIRFENAADTLKAAAREQEFSITDAVKEAKAALKAQNTSLSQQKVRLEIASAKADAVMQEIETLKAQLAAATEGVATLNAEEQAAATARDVAATKVKTAETSLAEAKTLAPEREAEARANVERARQVQSITQENDLAAKDGRPLPLVQNIASTQAKLDVLVKQVEQKLQQQLEVAQRTAEGMAGRAANFEQELKTLQEVEEQLTRLLINSTEDYAGLQDQIASLVEASDLLVPSAYDENFTDANRVVAKAETAAQARKLAAEEANVRTAKDRVIGALQKLLDENTELMQKPQSPSHAKMLDAQRERLVAQIEHNNRLYGKQIAAIAARRAALNLELGTAPSPDSKGYALEQLSNLTASKDKVLSLVQKLNAKLSQLGVQRNESISEALSLMGNANVNAVMQSMGLTPTNSNAKNQRMILGALGVDAEADIRKKLMESLAAQREVEAELESNIAKAKARVQAALVAFSSPKLSSTAARVAVEEKFAADEALKAALKERGDLHDDIIAQEREQLRLMQELSDISFRQRTEANIPWNSTPSTPAGTLAQTSAALERGEIKGPAAPEVNPEVEAFRERVEESDNLRGLRKELGQLKSQHSSLIETAQERATGPLPQTLTLENARALSPNANPFEKATERARLKNNLRADQQVLLEKMQILEKRIEELRGESVEKIASRQTTGRRGPAQKKTTVAGSFRTGTTESGEGAQNVGTQNKITEPRIEKPISGKAAMRSGELFAAEADLDRIEKLKERVQSAMDAAVGGKDKERIADLQEKLDRLDRAVDIAQTRVDAAMAAIQGGSVATQYNNRQSVELDAESRKALLDGRILDVVDSLAKNASTAEARRIAALLRPFLLRTKIRFDTNLKYNGESVPAYYDPQQNTAFFNPVTLFEEDVIHEFSHAATLRVLRTPEDQLTPSQLQAKRELRALYDSAVNDPDFKGEYALTNLEEFVSEVQSNKKVRQLLDKKPWYARLLRAFARLVGIKISETNSDKALKNIERIFMPSQKISGPPVPSANRAASAFDAFTNRIIAKPKSFWERQGNNKALELEMQGVDMRAGLREVLKHGDDKEFKQAMYNVLKADQKLPQTFAVMDSGPLEFYTDAKGFHGVRSSGKNSGKDVLKAIADVPLPTAQERVNKSTAYMAAIRGLNKGGAKLGVADDELRAVLAEVDANPALKKALEAVREKYNAYNKGMIQFLADTQAIPKSLAETLIKDGDYVPFYRVRENGMAQLVYSDNVVLNIGNIKNQPYLNELKGGNEQILPLNESLYRNTLLLTDKALTNMAQKSVAYGLQALGKGKGPVDPDTGKPTNKMVIRKGKGVDSNRVFRFNSEPDPKDPDDTGERWIEIDTDNTMAEGVPAELVVKSMEGAHLPLPAFLKIAGAFSDVLRSGVTRMPPYILRQLIRDPMSASFTAGLNYGPLRAVAKAGREFIRQYQGSSPTAEKLIKKGLIQSGIFTGDADDVSKIALQMADGRDQSWMNKVFAAMDKAALRADASTRVLVYDNAIKNGLSEVEADTMTMESMNFYKRGLNPMVQYGNRLIPFLNAQIQGLNVLYKAARGQMPFNEQQKIKQKFYKNAMFLFGAGLMYALAMEDDETFKNARPRDKYSNFFLHLPGVAEPIKIPTPFEAGYFFSLAVATVDAMKAETNTAEQWQAVRDMFLQSVPGWSSRGFPQIVKPVYEVWMNKNAFSGAPIETPRMENKDITERYNSSTTEFAKQLSKAVPLLSPVQIEHLTRAYLGVGPLAAFAAANSLFAPAAKGEAPTSRASDLPVFGSMFQKTYGGADSDTVYRLAKEAEQARTTRNSMIKEGRGADAKEYFESHKAEIRSAQAAGHYRQIIGRINTDMERTRNREDLSGDQKRARLDQLEKAKQDAADRFMKHFDEIASRV